jgi:hypothetical protein
MVPIVTCTVIPTPTEFFHVLAEHGLHVATGASAAECESFSAPAAAGLQ